MSEDIEEQVIVEIKHSGLLSLQLDDSSCSQLMVFVRYVHESNLKEEILFCDDLEPTTLGIDVMEMIDNYFDKHGLEW